MLCFVCDFVLNFLFIATIGGDYEGAEEDFERKVVRNQARLAAESRRFDVIDPKLGDVNVTAPASPANSKNLRQR